MTDAAYRTFSYSFKNGGLVCRDQYDRQRPGTYRNILNLESREEGSLSTRYGLAALSTDGATNFPLGAPVTTLGRMQGLSTPFNYAQAGAKLFRKNTDGIGSYGAAISSALSGSRMSMAPYRPNNNANPYMFLADDNVLLKDSGSLLNNWGIAPPTQPALISPVVTGLTNIELFDEAVTTSFTLSNFGSPAMIGRVSAQISLVASPGVHQVGITIVNASALSRTGGVATVTATAHGFVSGMRVQIFAVSGDQTFLASSAIITVTGVNAFTYPSPGANSTAVSANISALPSFQVGMTVTTTDGSPESVYITEVTTSGFVASFAHTHVGATNVVGNYLSGTVAANTTATVTKNDAVNLSFAASQVDPNNNIIQLYLLASSPLAVSEIKVLFDVGDGSFAQDYYYKSISMAPAQPSASGNVATGSVQSGAVFQRASGAVDVRTVGGDDPSLLPTDLPILQQLQPEVLTTGANAWSLIQSRLGDFVPVGAAGQPGTSWANVIAWQIQIKTSATLTTTIGIDDLVFFGGSDLDSFAGQEYDYRYTYYNLNTGDESGPSQIMVASDASTFGLFPGAFLPIPLAVSRQAIDIEPLQPTDSQVTHIRIYRRGGSLTQAWYFVTQIPVGTMTFVDTIADSIIEINNTLNVDADAPVTTVLPAPLSSTVTNVALPIGPGLTTVTLASGIAYPGQLVTIDTGIIQETCYLAGVSGSALTVYLQFRHGPMNTAVAIAASTRPQTPMSLMAIAFDKAWLAGDSNNPHVLYYSTTFQPETFPVENSLEIGTPDSPIMALIELQGLLFVFTTKRVYEILGAGSAIPTVIPTGVKHGLAAQFAWCVAEGTIYYLSYDGVYAFRGGQSTYMTEAVEWIWTGKNLGPVPAINLTQKAQVIMAYWNHEIFCRYVDQNGNSHRLISNETYGYRWRNDDQSAGNITAMYFAEDTGELFVGKDDGMVYQDRVNDFDSGGFVHGVQTKNPINYSLQSAQMDQSEVDPTNAKKNKIYQELTLDFDSAGQPVNVYLLFNGGALVPNGTTLSMGTFSQTGRGQVQININAGEGQEALNIGILLTGAATSTVTFYECQFRAASQGEFRRSYDSWWCGFGTDEWHLYKQLFAEYKADDPNGILLQAFTDGNMTAPAFTLTLPQTPGKHRASKKFRFPATKCRLIRFIATSASDFVWYDDSQWEHRKLGSSKGYERGKLSP